MSYNCRAHRVIARNWGSIPAAKQAHHLSIFLILLIGQFMNRFAWVITAASLLVISLFMLATHNDVLILIGGFLLGGTLVAFYLINRYFRRDNNNHNNGDNPE